MELKHVYVQDIFKRHYSGSFTSYILIYGFVYRNGPTNARKSGKGIPVPCYAPYLRPCEGRGVTPHTDEGFHLMARMEYLLELQVNKKSIL